MYHKRISLAPSCFDSLIYESRAPCSTSPRPVTCTLTWMPDAHEWKISQASQTVQSLAPFRVVANGPSGISLAMTTRYWAARTALSVLLSVRKLSVTGPEQEDAVAAERTIASGSYSR